jgi:ribosomal protein S18 acetylase RimI-like enzyme
MSGRAPLHPGVADVQAGDAFYLGAWHDGTLGGLLAIARDDEPGRLCIATLVVHPARQRRGLGRALVADALRRSGGMPLAVAAGAANAPALALYRGFGFEVVRRGSFGPDALPLVKLLRPAP